MVGKIISDDDLKSICEYFVEGKGFDYEKGLEWGKKIKKILNDDEISSFHEWEEIVGYEDVKNPVFNFKDDEYNNIRKYNCDTDFEQVSELESALYVVKHSERLLNSAVYLNRYGICEDNLYDVWNYLLCYDYKDSFIEIMNFSDWDDNDPDELFEKYNISKKKVGVEEKGFVNVISASLYEGDEYKLVMKIDTTIDDWFGVAVVVRKNCKLSPLEIISAGVSLNRVGDSIKK